MKSLTFRYTNDKVIRSALRENLNKVYAQKKKRIVEEFGVGHGTARIDMAVINGVMHGYEIKSDRDSLNRLQEQMDQYNSVFDKITLVVGKRHLFDAINIVPDWWGITVAKFDVNGSVILQPMRCAKDNKEQKELAVTRLLWRNEALELLENIGKADGLRSKPRIFIYRKLSTAFNKQALEKKVRDILFSREDWRLVSPLVLNGG